MEAVGGFIGTYEISDWLTLLNSKSKGSEFQKKVLQARQRYNFTSFFVNIATFSTTAVSNPISMVNITKTLWTMTIIVALFGNCGAEIIP